jgi:hypothetical protein
LAETDGFEPSVPIAQHGGLANRWFQPLTHVSGPAERGYRHACRAIQPIALKPLTHLSNPALLDPPSVRVHCAARRFAVNQAAIAQGGNVMPVSSRRSAALFLASLACCATPAAAWQVQTVDPSSPQAHSNPAPIGSGQPETMGGQYETGQSGYGQQSAPPPSDLAPSPPSGEAPPPPPPPSASRAPNDRTYQQGDVLDAAEGVFGRGAEGLAKMIERILKDQGRPTAYIAGREASGAFAVGLRYGSGVLHHKIEGDRRVFWTGPSLGFDFGGNASKTFVLVYNLYDSQELYHRFPAAEGTAYLIGGFTAAYLRRGDIVLIPIRLGVGWRLGANVGYMKFSERSKIMPF